MKFSAFWWTKIDDMIKNYIFLVRNFKLKIDYIRNRVKIFEFLLEFRKFRYCRPKKSFFENDDFLQSKFEILSYENHFK